MTRQGVVFPSSNKIKFGVFNDKFGSSVKCTDGFL